MSESLFEQAVEQFKAGKRKQEIARKKQEVRLLRRHKRLCKALEQIPKTIKSLEINDDEFCKYMEKAEDVKDFPKEHKGSIWSQAEGAIILTSHEFPERYWDPFLGLNIDGNVVWHVLLITNNETEERVGVFEHKHEKLGFIWEKKNPFDRSEVEETILKLANPKTVIATLFKNRPPL